MCQPSISGDPAPLTYKFEPIHLIPIRITIIAVAVAALFEAIQITWLRGFSLFVGSSKFFTPSSLLTLLPCIDCPRNFSISHRRSEVNDIVYLMIDEKDVILIYDYGLETSFSERIRQTLR